MLQYGDSWLPLEVPEFFIADRIGILVRARSLVPMQFARIGGWCGIGAGGSGCGVSVNGTLL